MWFTWTGATFMASISSPLPCISPAWIARLFAQSPGHFDLDRASLWALSAKSRAFRHRFVDLF